MQLSLAHADISLDLQTTYEKKVSRFWTGLSEELSAEFGATSSFNHAITYTCFARAILCILPFTFAIPVPSPLTCGAFPGISDSGVSGSMPFSFEPSPEYLSENIKKLRKSSGGAFVADKVTRRGSENKKESSAAARASAESASIGRSKWDNAEETQVCDACECRLCRTMRVAPGVKTQTVTETRE